MTITKLKLYNTFLMLITATVFMARVTYSQEIKPLENAKQLQGIKDDAKGSVLLINFWASWCKPCVKEFPDLVKLYNNYKDKGFRLVFISLDDVSDIDSKVVPILKNQGVDFTTYYNKFKKPEDLIDYIDKNWQGAIPSTYIYDKRGKMKNGFIGSKTYEDFESEINKYLD